MTKVKLLSLDELEKLGGFSLLQSCRSTGKPLLEADAIRKAAKVWIDGAPIAFVYSTDPTIQELFDFALGKGSSYREHPLLDGTVEGVVHIHNPKPNQGLRRFLELNQYGKLPPIDLLQVGTDYRTLIECEWIYPPKPKKDYKPHSFQPAKGEAPRSCNPNPKTVAKNRAKRKLKKK